MFIKAGDRLRTGQPLYADSSSGQGVIGPPAQAVLFTPFAAIAAWNVTAARVIWYVVNLAALGFGVWWWARAIVPERVRRPSDLASPLVLWPLAAIALPVETNFEHQNMNPLLLGLTGAAAALMASGRSLAGGAVLGSAAAVKVFPALAVLHLAFRGQWRSLWAALAAIAALMSATAIWYGWTGASEAMRAFAGLASAGGWPDRPQNQSVYATAARLFPDSAVAVAATVGVLAVLTLAWLAWRWRRTGPAALGIELALALALAVVSSPIAWDHYWVLMFPAFLAVYALDPRSRIRWVFWPAAVLVSGLSPLTLGLHGFNLARAWSCDTVGGFILIGALITASATTRSARPPC